MAFHLAPPDSFTSGFSPRSEEILIFTGIHKNAVIFFPQGALCNYDCGTITYLSVRCSVSCTIWETSMSGSWLTSLNLDSCQERLLTPFSAATSGILGEGTGGKSRSYSSHRRNLCSGGSEEWKTSWLKLLLVPVLRWPASILLTCDFSKSTEKNNPQRSEPGNLGISYLHLHKQNLWMLKGFNSVLDS